MKARRRVELKIGEEQARKLRTHINRKGISQSLYVGLIISKYVYDSNVRLKCRRHLWINQQELIGDKKHNMVFTLPTELRNEAKEIATNLGIKFTTLVLKLIMIEFCGKVDFKI